MKNKPDRNQGAEVDSLILRHEAVSFTFGKGKMFKFLPVYDRCQGFMYTGAVNMNLNPALSTILGTRMTRIEGMTADYNKKVFNLCKTV